jgi:hypothetical protein
MNSGARGRSLARAQFKKADKLEKSPETWEAYFDPHGY